MPYRRSYDYTITQEQKEEFIKSVKLIMDWNYWFYLMKNHFEYDMCRDKKVKTEHITLFFHTWSAEIYQMIIDYNSLWYSVQINSTKDQSIPEINHLHFIKTIDEN